MSLINDPDFTIAMMRKELFYNAEDKTSQRLIGESLKSFLADHAESTNPYLIPIIPTLQDSINGIVGESPPIVFPEDMMNYSMLKPVDANQVDSSKNSLNVANSAAMSMTEVQDTGSNLFMGEEDNQEEKPENEDSLQRQRDNTSNPEERFQKSAPLVMHPNVSALAQLIIKKSHSSNPFADVYSVFVRRIISIIRKLCTYLVFN